MVRLLVISAANAGTRVDRLDHNSALRYIKPNAPSVHLSRWWLHRLQRRSEIASAHSSQNPGRESGKTARNVANLRRWWDRSAGAGFLRAVEWSNFRALRTKMLRLFRAKSSPLGAAGRAVRDSPRTTPSELARSHRSDPHCEIRAAIVA